MELQTIFNKICAHLIRQGEAAMSAHSGDCVYLDHGTGNMCAVGCLIPRDLYHEGIEGRVATGGAVKDVLKAAGVLVDDGENYRRGDLLEHCQCKHDAALRDSGLGTWAEKMVVVAEKFDLIVPKQVRELADG